MSKTKVESVNIEDIEVRGLTSMDIFKVARIINGCTKATKNEVLEALYPSDDQVNALADAQKQLKQAEGTLNSLNELASQDDLEPDDVRTYVQAYREGRIQVAGDMSMDMGRLVFAVAALMEEREKEVVAFFADIAGLKPEQFTNASIDLALEILRKVYEQESERLGAFFTRVSGLVNENSGS